MIASGAREGTLQDTGECLRKLYLSATSNIGQNHRECYSLAGAFSNRVTGHFSRPGPLPRPDRQKMTCHAGTNDAQDPRKSAQPGAVTRRPPLVFR